MRQEDLSKGRGGCMFAKILGSIMLVTAFSLMGYSVSQRFISRHRELIFFQMALEILGSEIRFIKTPIPTAFKKIANRLDEPVSTVFLEAAEKIEGGEQFPSQVWEAVLKANSKKLSLFPHDYIVLKQLGVVLEGDSDSEGQVRQIRLVETELQRAILEADAEKKKNVKVWRYLGLLGGLAVVILFF